MIPFVLDAELLRATDRAARRRETNRSALIRGALKEHLRLLDIQELEAKDRRGYEAKADRRNEGAAWEKAAWPAE